jgi:hypothetical protein
MIGSSECLPAEYDLRFDIYAGQHGDDQDASITVTGS